MDYIKHYNNLCNTRKEYNRYKGDGNYYENHHIIPRWLKGSNENSNLVLLTAREHYLAHYFLFKHYKDKNSSAAFHLMNNSINSKFRDSKKYEELRIFQSELLKGDNNPSKREDVKKLISIKNTGKLNGMYGKVRELNPFFGKTHSKEFLRKKQLLHSNPIDIFDIDNNLLNKFECVSDAAKHFNCTTKNILFRLNKKQGKFGIFKNKIVKISND